MNIRTTLILAFVFMALGSFAFFDPFNLKAERQNSKEKDSSVFWIRDKKIDWLEIIVDSRVKIRLRCLDQLGCGVGTAGAWKIESPLDELADNTNLGTLLGTIDTLAMIDTIDFENEAINLSEFGLDKPSLELQIALKDGSRQNIKLGSPAAVGSNFYAQVSGRDKMLILVASHFSESLKREVFHWRNKRIFPDLKTEDIRSIQWLGGEKILASQEAGTWTILRPLAVRGNSGVLNGLAGTLAYLAATQIVSEDKDGPSSMTFKKNSLLKLEFVEKNEKRHALEIFEAHGKRYVSSPSQKWLAQIEPSVADRFKKKMVEYRFRKLLEESIRNKLASLEFEFPRQKKKASFRRLEDNSWAQSGGEAVKLSKERLQRFLAVLGDGDVTEFLSGEANLSLLRGPLDLRLRLFDKDQKLLEELLFVVAGRKAAYTKGELPNEIRVLTGEFLSEMPIRLEDLDIDNNKVVVVDDKDLAPHAAPGHDHGH